MGPRALGMLRPSVRRGRRRLGSRGRLRRCRLLPRVVLRRVPYSRRLAGRIAKELKDAMLALGGTSRIQWFGTTAFRIMTEDAHPPFRQVSLTATLRPREMPINWAIGTAQGRQDAALAEAS